MPYTERRSASSDKTIGAVKEFLGFTTFQLGVKRKFKWKNISHRQLNAFNPNGIYFPVPYRGLS